MTGSLNPKVCKFLVDPSCFPSCSCQHWSNHRSESSASSIFWCMGRAQDHRTKPKDEFAASLLLSSLWQFLTLRSARVPLFSFCHFHLWNAFEVFRSELAWSSWNVYRSCLRYQKLFFEGWTGSPTPVKSLFCLNNKFLGTQLSLGALSLDQLVRARSLCRCGRGL